MKGLAKVYIKKSYDFDIPTKLRYADFLLKENGQEIEINKRFKNNKKKLRSKLLKKRKAIQQFQKVVLQEALDEQFWLINTKLLKNKKDKYRYNCRFRLGFEDLSKIKGYDLLCKRGFYNNKNNILGVVKDHRVSIKFGFENNIAPDILGHPANCEFMCYSQNASKSADSSISLEELLELINNW